MTHITATVRQIAHWFQGQLDELLGWGLDVSDLDIHQSDLITNLQFGRE